MVITRNIAYKNTRLQVRPPLSLARQCIRWYTGGFQEASDSSKVTGQQNNEEEIDYNLSEESQAESFEIDTFADLDVVFPTSHTSFGPSETAPENLDDIDVLIKYTGMTRTPMSSTGRVVKHQLQRAAQDLLVFYQENKFREAIQLWEENQCFEGQVLNYRSYACFIACLAKHTKNAHARVQTGPDKYRKMGYDALARIQSLGYSTGFGVLNDIIRLEAQYGNLEKMKEWKIYLEKNHTPSLGTFLPFFRLYSIMGKAAAAKDLWHEMVEKWEITPSLQAYVSLIANLGKQGDPDWRGYYDAAKEILKEGASLERNKWRILHNAAMEAAIGMGEYDLVLHFRDEMKAQGIFLDMWTFPKLLRAASLSRNWEMAIETIDEASTRPDFSLNLFFWEVASEVLRDMAETQEQMDIAKTCQMQCNEIIVTFRSLGVAQGTKRPPPWLLSKYKDRKLRVRTHWRLASKKFVQLDVPVSDLLKQMAVNDGKPETIYDDKSIDAILDKSFNNAVVNKTFEDIQKVVSNDDNSALRKASTRDPRS